MVRHPGVRLGPEILDNHFLDMTIAAMQIADRHQRLDPFLSRLSNANQQAGRERHLCPARFLNGGEASGRSFIGRSEMRSSAFAQPFRSTFQHDAHGGGIGPKRSIIFRAHQAWIEVRSEEHTSELQSLMRTSYAVLFLTKKTQAKNTKQ